MKYCFKFKSSYICIRIPITQDTNGYKKGCHDVNRDFVEPKMSQRQI